MAYMDQAKKAKIAAALKRVVPAGWKYSLAVRHHSEIVCTISEAPFDLLKAFRANEYRDPESITHADVSVYHVRRAFEDECVADVMEAIVAALNTDNHDRSDLMTDYFDVGHYVTLQIGRWDRPFRYVPAALPAVKEN